MKFELASSQKAAQADIVACMRLKDLPEPYVLASLKNCEECGEAIWVADTSPKGVKLVCVICAEEMIAKEKAEGKEATFLLTEKSAKEIDEYYNAAGHIKNFLRKKGWLK